MSFTIGGDGEIVKREVCDKVDNGSDDNDDDQNHEGQKGESKVRFFCS